MDRRRHEDSGERNYKKRDDQEEEYRGRRRYGSDGRDDRTRNRRSTSTSNDRDRDRARVPRSRSPRREYHDDKRSYTKSSHIHASQSNYRDLDRPEVPKERKDIEMKESPRNEAVRPVETAENEELLDEDAQLAAFLGITSFASTKGQKVAGNAANSIFDVSASKKKREYRQYLFVKGSYDIPLTKDQLEPKEKDQQAKNQR